MKLNLKKKADALDFEVTNEEQNVVSISSKTEIGGSGNYVRPMQLVLAGLAGCSAIDMILILEKQKQQIEDFGVEVEGEKGEEVPHDFKKIKMTVKLDGALDEAKVKRAVELSIDKYCSVRFSLNPEIDLTYSIILNGNELR